MKEQGSPIIRKPMPPQDLLDKSRKWATDLIIDSNLEQIRENMEIAYVEGLRLYVAHRNQLRAEVKNHGGVKKIHLKRILDDWGANYVELKDGTEKLASDFVTMPRLSIDLGDLTSEVQEEEISAHRTYDIQIRFGGLITGCKSELDDNAINYHLIRGNPFEFLLEDNTYFPEDIGLSETLTTNVFHEKIQHTTHYSLFGELWRPHLIFDPVDSPPDPYANPIGYRNWALRGNRKILDLHFQAPTMFKNENGKYYTQMATVIEKGHVTNGNKTEAIAQFDRFSSLLHYYGNERFPTLFQNSSYSLAAQSQISPQLPSAKKL